MSKKIGIYIHIPFCKSKCYYCDFVSYTDKEGYVEKYIDSVCKEILEKAELLSEYEISTIYFGGGTPSSINSKYIVKIMNTLKLFSTKLNEVTIEINPNSITKEKLLDYKNAGINRLSIGLQTTHDEILRKIGRIHTYADFLNTLKLANIIGFDNISIDLIYPLPELTLNMFKETLNNIVALSDDYNIKHISIYNLEIHENTKLAFLLNEKYLTICDEDTEYQMKELLEKTLEEKGFLKYEISNFAKVGYESVHNTNYWKQGEYLGLGVHSSSFILGTRYKNTDNIDEYILAISKGNNITNEKIHLDKLDLMKEYMMLNLRLTSGVNTTNFKNRFSVSVDDVFYNEIKKLTELGLIIDDKKKNAIYLTKRGSEVANLVFQEFV